MTIQELIEKIEKKRQRYYQGGGPKAIERQHSLGKLTARERLALLYDPGTFQEENLFIRPIRTGFDIDQRELPGDAVVIGTGKVNGRLVYSYIHDFTVLGGAMSMGQNHKVARVMDKAAEAGIPYVGMIDSGGVKIHDLFGRPANRPILGAENMAFTRGHFPSVSRDSGVIPQISLMIGPCYAGSAYSPIMADFVIMRKGISYMSVASPQLLKAVTFADINQEELGGAEVHAKVTGSCDFLTESDEESIATCRELLSYLPSNWKEKPWKDKHLIIDTGDDPNRRDDALLDIVSADLSTPYDMHDIITRVIDKGQFLELQKLYAPNMIIGFGRMEGKTVGIVANNPIAKGGYIDLDACDKESRFIRFCDAFNIPLIFFVDTPGFLPGVEQEQSLQGLLRRAAKALFAVCEATVPKIGVCVGTSHGPARLVMGTPREGVDMVFSWPQAKVTRMDPREVVEKIWKEEIERAKKPDEVREKKYQELLDTYIDYPFHAAEYLMVDEIIDPRDTRSALIRRLEVLANKEAQPRPWRKHPLMPR
ncbi:acyl-CoA carboxylase subunit beta [Chloroflexota bacterium]